MQNNMSLTSKLSVAGCVYEVTTSHVDVLYSDQIAEANDMLERHRQALAALSDPIEGGGSRF